MAPKNPRSKGGSGSQIVESVYAQSLGQQGKVFGSKIIYAEKKKPAIPTAPAGSRSSGSSGSAKKAKSNKKKNSAKGGAGGKKKASGGGGGAQGGSGPQVLDPAAMKKRQKKAREAFRAGRVLIDKLVEGVDVVLEVLDARDPQRCRSTYLERIVQEAGKKLVFVLNKTDLVPRHSVERWLEALRKEHLAVPFNAVESTSSADALARLLKSLAGNINKEKPSSITIGVVGFPSVGRGSVLRSLKQSKDLPSTTKFYVNLGALLGRGGRGPINFLLRSKILPGEDLISATESILMRCKQQTLMITYSVPRFDHGSEFLNALARQQGHLFKGGVPDTLTAARSFLRELGSGKTPFYTNPPLPPVSATSASAPSLKKATKAEKGYGLDAGLDSSMLDTMSFSADHTFSFALAAQDGLEEDPEDDGEDEDGDDEEEAPQLVAADNGKKTKSKKQVAQEPDVDEDEEEEDQDEDDKEEEEEEEEEIAPVTTKRGAKSLPVQKRPVKKAKKSAAAEEDGDAPYAFGEFA
ncbi:Guanine nucleotide-binding protein-like 3 [Mortierella sp. AD031]|nr:Guanine nucleotide-binding protein-like 3 [Mortierella sp. AD031]